MRASTLSGICVVDKPQGFTSHDVVAKLRSRLGQRRIGHGGTLDPMATGVLVVFAGRATRAVSYLPGDKTYLAHIRPGLATDTLDITGKTTSQTGLIPREDELVSLLPRFTGEIEQIPPMVSAVKIGGRPLHELARKGLEIERPPRRVSIYAIEYLGRSGDDFVVRVSCSAGTYIRTLADDMGRALGCGACLSFLRRERSGPFDLSHALAIDEIYPEKLRPVDELFKCLGAYTASPGEELILKNGGKISPGPFEEGERLRVYGPDGGFLMLGKIREGYLCVEKSFFEVIE